MKVFYRSSNRIKGKVAPEQILPSNTCTYKFPDGAATVVLTNVSKEKASFKVYFNGDRDSGGYQSTTLRAVAEQIHRDGEYKTHFGQNSWLPTDKIPEITKMINEIEQIVNS